MRSKPSPRRFRRRTNTYANRGLKGLAVDANPRMDLVATDGPAALGSCLYQRGGYES